MISKPNAPPTLPAPLYGLVLAGGRGTRLCGYDKGRLDLHGIPQARWALALLERECPARSFIGVRADQAGEEPYCGQPLVIDDGGQGPAAGLAAAFRRVPEAAWLVIAADMPLLTPSLLKGLIAHRDPAGLATAYRHRDGTPEPLCAIWEPRVRESLPQAGATAGVSMRRLLEAGPAKLVPVADEAALSNINTPADLERIRRSIKPS